MGLPPRIARRRIAVNQAIRGWQLGWWIATSRQRIHVEHNIELTAHQVFEHAGTLRRFPDASYLHNIGRMVP